MVLWWVASVASAQDQVLRTITLVDGRRFDAEVLSTEPTGVEVQVPQGTMLVPFELLVDISPIPGNTPEVEPWRVLAEFPDDVEPTSDAVLHAIPALAPSHVGGSDDLSPGVVSQIATCGADVRCMADALRDQPWRFVIAGHRADDGHLVVSSLVSTSRDTPPHEIDVSVADAAHLWPALHEALGLDVPELPASLVAPTGRKPKAEPSGHGGIPAARTLAAQSLIPIPGAPALFGTHQGGDAALAFAVVLPAAAAWTGLSAAATAEPRDFAVMAGAGYLGLTVMTNQWVGDRGRRRLSAAAAPTQGGAVAVVGGAF